MVPQSEFDRFDRDVKDYARDFERGIADELEEIKTLILARREAKLGEPLTHEAMGRTFAIGAIDAAIWYLQRRAKGDLT